MKPDQLLSQVKEKHPLIHNITNYVTVNDCANILLACGASPIMSDDIHEVEEITALCDGLNINIGTLNARTIESMIAAGKKANELNHPVLLDPVGAGASRFRTETAKKLLEKIHFSVIRGNMSEIKALAGVSSRTSGVDASLEDQITEENLEKAVVFARNFARETDSIVTITGAIDLVSDQDRTFVIRNGHPKMSQVTGTGCMLSALACAFVSANPEQPLEAASAAVAMMGLAGEIASRRMQPQDGTGTYHMYLMDAISMNPKTLEEGADYEIR